MGLDFGVRQLLEENYNQFIDATSNLANPDKARVRAGYGSQPIGTERAPAIVLPGLDDVLVLGPRPTITKEHWRAYFAERRGGPDARLSPEIRVEIARKQRVRDRFANSPTPEWSREFARALTAVDNVQDLLSTVAVVGRFALRPLVTTIPWVRFPILGLMGAASLLNTLGLVGMLISPLYGLLCGGAGEGLAAGLVTATRFRALKQLLTGAGKTNRRARRIAGITNFYKGAQLGGAAQAAATGGAVARTAAGWMGPRRPAQAVAIEGVQVTKDLFGYGMSFGALMGLASDAAFGVESARRGLPPQLRTPLAPGAFWQAVAPILERYPTEAITDARNASMVLAWAPWLLSPRSPLDDHERQQVLYAHYCAHEFLYPILASPAAGDMLDRALGEEWTPPVFRYTDTAAAMAEGGLLEVDERNIWPEPGLRGRLTGEQLAGLNRAQCDGFWNALDLIPLDEPVRAGLEMLLSATMERTAVLMLGGEDAIRWELETPWAMAEGMVDCGVFLDAVSNPEGVIEMAQTFELQRGGRSKVMRTREDWQSLGAAHGVRVFPLLEPGDPLPQPG